MPASVYSACICCMYISHASMYVRIHRCMVAFACPIPLNVSENNEADASCTASSPGHSLGCCSRESSQRMRRIQHHPADVFLYPQTSEIAEWTTFDQRWTSQGGRDGAKLITSCSQIRLSLTNVRVVPSARK